MEAVLAVWMTVTQLCSICAGDSLTQAVLYLCWGLGHTGCAYVGSESDV